MERSESPKETDSEQRRPKSWPLYEYTLNELGEDDLSPRRYWDCIVPLLQKHGPSAVLALIELLEQRIEQLAEQERETETAEYTGRRDTRSKLPLQIPKIMDMQWRVKVLQAMLSVYAFSGQAKTFGEIKNTDAEAKLEQVSGYNAPEYLSQFRQVIKNNPAFTQFNQVEREVEEKYPGSTGKSRRRTLQDALEKHAMTYEKNNFEDFKRLIREAYQHFKNKENDV